MDKLRPCLAEFIGTFALVFVGIGAIKTAGHDVLGVALAHGLTIAAFATATMHISGGQLNPAVTFGLVCGGHMTVPNALRYWISQLLGGFCAGSGISAITLPSLRKLCSAGIITLFAIAGSASEKMSWICWPRNLT